MTQKYNIPTVDEANKKFAYTPEQWVEFFTMYKKMVDSHVMPSSKYYASFGKSNMYEMKPWINGEWAGTYMWNSTITKYSDNLTKPAKLDLGPYPMLPDAKMLAYSLNLHKCSQLVNQLSILKKVRC